MSLRPSIQARYRSTPSTSRHTPMSAISSHTSVATTNRHCPTPTTSRHVTSPGTSRHPSAARGRVRALSRGRVGPRPTGLSTPRKHHPYGMPSQAAVSEDGGSDMSVETERPSGSGHQKVSRKYPVEKDLLLMRLDGTGPHGSRRSSQRTIRGASESMAGKLPATVPDEVYVDDEY